MIFDTLFKTFLQPYHYKLICLQSFRNSQDLKAGRTIAQYQEKISKLSLADAIQQLDKASPTNQSSQILDDSLKDYYKS